MTNIAELLKDCPKGTKLYSPLFGEVKLDDAGGMIYVTTKYGSSKCFTETGCYYVDNETFSTECLLFPGKGQTWSGVEIKHPYKKKFEIGDWITDGWNPPVKVSGFSLGFTYYFSEGNIASQGWKVAEDNYHHWSIKDAKEGDVLVSSEGSIIIYGGEIADNGLLYYYVALNKYKLLRTHEQISVSWVAQDSVKPATKEQRESFFSKMKEEGYEWDEKKKELKKISKHYDISNFHAGMPVLVRDGDDDRWNYVLFSHTYDCIDGKTYFNACGWTWDRCIPFNDKTKHLLGTTDPCGEEFINW